MINKRIILIYLLIFGIISCKQAHNIEIVNRIDHFMLVSKNPKECYAFLTETCKLPIAWPYVDVGKYRSGGVYLGNCVFEVVEFNRNSIFGIRGIAFTPSMKIEKVQEILKIRGINETTIDYQRYWTSLGVDNLISDALVFFCEYRKSVRYPKNSIGNLYGIKEVNKVFINTSNFTSSHKVWKKILTKHREIKKGLWKIKGSPFIELVAGTSDNIESLQLRVNDIKKIKALLLQNGMLDSEEMGIVKTDPEKSFGIVFEFIE